MKHFIYRVSVTELYNRMPGDPFALALAQEMMKQGQQGWELCGNFTHCEYLYFLWKKEKTDEKSNDSGSTGDSSIG